MDNTLDVGASRAMRELGQEFTGAHIARAINGEAGDWPDILTVMENISAWMDGRPSSHLFAVPGAPEPCSVIVLLRPAERSALALVLAEVAEMEKGIRVFGFDPATLQPRDNDK